MTSNARLQKFPVVQKKAKSRASFFWLIPTQVAALVAAAGAAAGENLLRMTLLGGVLSALLVPLLVSLEAGLFAMMIFEPFRGFLRRAQYIFVPYSETEPIHLLVPVATICAFLIVLFRHKLEIVRLTPLAGWTSALAAICLVQMFNPLQGSIYIGITGGLFFIVPMAWFYFGQSARADFLPNLLRLIVILGLIASLHGVYQLVFGYPYFEKYWIDNTDLYSSIAVDKIQRALATFNNSEEWGRYIQIGCTIAVGFVMSKSESNGKRVMWFIFAALLFLMIAITGQRTSIFGLFLSGGILFLTGAKTFQSLAARVLLMLAPVVLLIAIAKPGAGDGGDSDLDENDKVGTMLNHTTQGTVNPTGEGSLEARFDTWSKLLTVDIPRNPVGIGLGATSLAANRENTEDAVPIDNHFFSLAISAGVPAMLILFWIMIRSLTFTYRGWRRCAEDDPDSEQTMLWRIVMALLAAFLLNNFFGTSFTIYSTAPIGWLLIGWVSLSYKKLENAEPDVVTAEKRAKTINAKIVSPHDNFNSQTFDF